MKTLTSLKGLSNLRILRGSLVISGDDALTGFDGLEKLETVQVTTASSVSAIMTCDINCLRDWLRYPQAIGCVQYDQKPTQENCKVDH